MTEQQKNSPLLQIVYGVIRDEKEFGRELPGDSFYKAVALSVCKKFCLKYSELKEAM